MSGMREKALQINEKYKGKLEILAKIPLRDTKDLSFGYSPEIGEACKEISYDANKAYDYTMKSNLVAVVSNGTAVSGLGNIGPRAAMPVMEGKAVLFKAFAGVDAFPICLDTEDTETMINAVKLLEPTFGGVVLENIAAPECFELEERLIKECGIPVFHNDQHGTAVVTVAGLINALKLVHKVVDQTRIVVNGAGAAGIAIVKLLSHMGAKDIILCDSEGVVYEGRPVGMNGIKEEIARMTNKERETGTLADALINADVFIGVSSAGAVTKEMVQSMNRDPIVFAMANPVPEITPEDAKIAGAQVVLTGRPDFPNQVNHVLAFPGIFRGVLDVRAKTINEPMKLAAVYAIADLIHANDLRPDYVIPHPFDPRVAMNVAAAVAQAAMNTGSAQIHVDPEHIKERTKKLIRKDDAVGSYYSWYINMTI